MDALSFGLLGLGIGALYALVAQGIVLVYRGSGVVNFAHGTFALLAGFIYYELTANGGWPVAPAILIGVATASLAGVLTHLCVMKPLSQSSPLTRLIATVGVFTVITQLAFLRYGNDTATVSPFLPTNAWRPFSGPGVSADRLIIAGIVVAITGVLYLLYRHTRFGMATTAVAENETAAAALGLSPDLVAAGNWAIGGALAGVAGVVIVPITGAGVLVLSLLVIPGLAAALVGGFRSFPLTLVGGLLIGVLESEAARYISAPGWSESIPFLVIVAILSLRGRALPLRSHIQERLPSLGTGRIRPRLVIAVAAVAIALCLVASDDWVSAITTTAVTGIIALSLIVVTGYAGQLSLAQYALAGMGAFISTRLASSFNLPFELAIVIGIAAAVPIGVVVGLPAVRTRGVNLAIATLGLALALERLVFGNRDYTGGYDGITVKSPSLFGWNVDPLSHPGRYGAVAVALTLLAALAVANMRRGRSGRRLIAVRTNERAAAALGIGVMGAKLYAFGLGAGIAGLGGVLLAYRNPHVLFDPYTTTASIQAVVQTVIGGVGYVAGAIVGAALAPGAITSQLVSYLGSVENYLPLIAGAVLILNLVAAPSGVVHEVVRATAGFLRRGVGAGRQAPQAAESVHSAAGTRVPPRTLAVEDLAVSFGGVVALKRASLRVAPGEVVGLIGPNGAGKTTLIDVMTGFVGRHGGTVTLDGRSVERWSPRRRARAGLGRSFQSLELFEDMTVEENLVTACDRGGRLSYLTDLLWPGRPALPPAAAAAVEEFGLGQDLQRRPAALPYGRRRLVAIARAVAAEPSVLLLDEPAAGLAAAERDELRTLIRRLAEERGMAVLLVEHDVELVMSTCDRVVAMDFGLTIAEGAPSAVRSNERVIAAYLGSDDETPTGALVASQGASA